MEFLDFDDCSIAVQEVDENNRKQGRATITYNNGHREETYYINDIKNGESTYYFDDYTYEKFTYVNGVKQGPATYYNSVLISKYNYVDRVITGAGTIYRKPFYSQTPVFSSVEHVFYKNNNINGFSIQNVFGEDSKYIIRYYVDGFQKFALRANTSSKYGFDFGYVNTNEDFITLFEEDDILFADNINDMKDILFKLNKPYGDRQ